MAVKSMEEILAAYSPFPMCVVNGQGKVLVAGERIGEVFLYEGIEDADIFALTGIKFNEYLAAEAGTKVLTVSRNDKVFKISAQLLENTDSHMAVFFQDITNYEALKKIYNNERTCMAIVHVDNLDELLKNTDDENDLTLLSSIDKTIRQWAARYNASITRYRDDMYHVIIDSASCDKLIEGKFSVLDDVRALNTDQDFPVTLSIGIGIGGKTLAQTDKYSEDALDLALGRGGDQAVIKNITNISYYGGKTQTVEKSNKGKSRVIAHALKQLIDQASNIMIMGHTNPDMDSFGAALGVTRMIKMAGKEPYIVINSVSDALSEIYKAAKETELYNFINGEKAVSMANEETLLIVVDTHRPSYTDCPELLEKTEKIAVIDHHRKMEEFIENATLSYIESYASSASELVSEMIQYSEERKSVTRLEAEALLAGMTVDTNEFAVKTGVRTFEAASWLRRMGADTTSVKKFLQTDAKSFLIRSKCIANAEISEEEGIAFSILEGVHPDSQILCAQVADELLLVKGIKASFVAGVNMAGKTVVSARSLGDVNVQVIMEKFGGGGHLTTAGAQLDDTPEDIIARLKDLLIKPKED
ncbi:MAG: DHH family phosphoesterase [Firmicutes bacterium]|nr:DHH family phosphoesterase [Bacillota bacterium]MBQ9972796.1 DHH family phosphoesterase [Bacillota bacterium]